MSGELNVSAGTLVCTPLKAMPDTTPIPEEQPRADAPAHAESTPDSQPSDPPPTAQPETPELPATPELPQEHVPMLEVHPPHEAVHSWKDAFIHIGIIVAGLLIAVGLDQAVEFIHHRYQIAETRQALRIERRVNINHFAMQTEEFY